MPPYKNLAKYFLFYLFFGAHYTKYIFYITATDINKYFAILNEFLFDSIYNKKYDLRES